MVLDRNLRSSSIIVIIVNYNYKTRQKRDLINYR